MNTVQPTVPTVPAKEDVRDALVNSIIDFILRYGKSIPVEYVAGNLDCIYYIHILSSPDELIIRFSTFEEKKYYFIENISTDDLYELNSIAKEIVEHSENPPA